MAWKSVSLYLLACSVLFFSSCDADCKQIKIEKVEWITHYENYKVDTTVGYSTQDFVKFAEWPTKRKNDKHLHKVTILNTNKQYSNKFAVEFRIQFKYNLKEKWTYKTDYVEIPANSEYTFNYEWSGARGTFDSDFNVLVSVLQQPKSIILTKRIDYLKTSKIAVDNCSVNVDLEKAKYNTIKAMYEKLLNEGLIQNK